MFGPVSPSPTRLKSCAAASGPRRLAVAEREQRDLLADQQLLDHDRAPGLAERAADEAGLDGGQRARAIGADRDALAGREAVGLDDAGAAELVDRAPGRVDVRARHGSARSARPRPASASSRTPSSPRRGRPPTTGRRRRCARAAGRHRARARAAARARSRRARPRGGGPARHSPPTSSTATSWQVAMRAMPGLPGAQCSSRQVGLAASACASACSRPPEPTSRILIAASLDGRAVEADGAISDGGSSSSSPGGHVVAAQQAAPGRRRHAPAAVDVGREVVGLLRAQPIDAEAPERDDHGRQRAPALGQLDSSRATAARCSARA